MLVANEIRGLKKFNRNFFSCGAETSFFPCYIDLNLLFAISGLSGIPNFRFLTVKNEIELSRSESPKTKHTKQPPTLFLKLTEKWLQVLIKWRRSWGLELICSCHSPHGKTSFSLVFWLQRQKKRSGKITNELNFPGKTNVY